MSDAQRHYADAIAVLLRNEQYASDELRELELELLRSFDVMNRGTRYGRVYGGVGLDGAALAAEPWRSWMDSMALLAEWELPRPVGEPAPEQTEVRNGAPTSNPFYEGRCLDHCLGRQSLQRLLTYEVATSAPLREQVEAFIRIADWEGREQALEQYERALKMLQEAGAQTLIDELFAPKTPIVLPTFLPNPLVSPAAQASGHYIDVGFEISRYGEARRVQILEATSVTDTDKASLVQLIERSRFRPRVTEGDFARASPVIFRYYLQE